MLWWKIYENQIISDDKLPLKKTLELYSKIRLVRSVFYEGNKNYLNLLSNI